MPACLFNVPATRECISGTDLHRQFYVLPHRDKKLRIKLLTSPGHGILTPGQPVPALTVQRPAPLGRQFLSHWYVSAALEADALTTRPTRRYVSAALEADALTTRPTRRKVAASIYTQLGTRAGPLTATFSCPVQSGSVLKMSALRRHATVVGQYLLVVLMSSFAVTVGETGFQVGASIYDITGPAAQVNMVRLSVCG